ncbi:transferase [Bifidobacterium callimiconis]|uniref:Acetyltransferase n=2 Tax=Bifidobacterium callimiconis TaxID=2306973 RepID=A0A430FBL6_9BIFI|nr:transferase [Bifidobacterium callimiconis]
MFIKSFIRRMVLGAKASPEAYVKFLREKGIRIGERTRFFSPTTNTIDLTRPWLISIGDDVQITNGVTILTHGYDWSVIKGKYHEVLGSSGKVTIGNNVFIGMHSTILKGVTIGNNVIIGANSLVNADIPDNCVAAGNPVRVIMDLAEYREKRIRAQYDEAAELVREYRLCYGRDPGEKELHEFFWLFTDDSATLPESWKTVMQLVGNEKEANKKLRQHSPMFKDMQSFLESVK